MEKKIVVKFEKKELKEEWALFCKCDAYELWVCNKGCFEKRNGDGGSVRSDNPLTWISFARNCNIDVKLKEAIAIMFLPNPSLLPYVNRIDASKPPSVDNLEWHRLRHPIKRDLVRQTEVGSVVNPNWLLNAERRIEELRMRDKAMKATAEHMKARFGNDGENNQN